MYYGYKRYFEDLQTAYNSIPDVRALRGSTVLVAGAVGLIGSFLTDLLLYMNDEEDARINIYALGRNGNRLRERFASHFDDRRLHFIVQDVIKPVRAEGDFDYIIHAAGDGYPAAFRERPVETMTPALIGTYELLKFAKAHNAKRFLYISSGEVYGRGAADRHAFKEEEAGVLAAMEVRSCYPMAKRAAETMCAAYEKEYGLETIVVRPGHTYGAGVTPKDNRATVQFLNNALEGENIIMYSEGSQLRSYTYVADCVSALLTALIKGESSQAYNIANPASTVSVAGFAKILADAAGVDLEFHRPDKRQAGELTPIEYAVLDSSRLEALGWGGKYGIREGIKRMYEIAKDIRENG